MSRFVDYRSDDGLFRKYRIVFIDGQPYACHLAIADRWDIWYMNAGWRRARASAVKKKRSCRRSIPALRNVIAPRWPVCRNASGSIISRSIARKPREGSLLIFEADNTAIVHDMDPPDVFPYKVPQMRKVFDAFAAMLHRRAGRAIEAAA